VLAQSATLSQTTPDSFGAYKLTMKIQQPKTVIVGESKDSSEEDDRMFPNISDCPAPALGIPDTLPPPN
jgi:hypothetical protein